VGVGLLALSNLPTIQTALGSILTPIDIVSTVGGVKGEKLKETDGRTNVLVLGSDQRTSGYQVGSMLTDTIILISLGKSTKDAVIISLPRDLWVQSQNGGRMKINELYGSYGGKEGTGSEEILQAVQAVLGVPVHYYAVINFALFEELITTLGGIDVPVETSFEDFEYPIEGKEMDTCGRSDKEITEMEAKDYSYPAIFPCRYEHLTFVKGLTKMDGELALKYSRSRHGNNGEGTDFARAKRQQNVILAVKQKALSTQTLLDFTKIKSLFELYAKNVDTNVDLSSLRFFYTLGESVGFNTTRTLVLDDSSESEQGGLLYAPTDTTLYRGKYVLIPKTGDYSQIHAYIQKYLFD
jgi:LCP family protein required for cell wall assembly